MKNRVIAVAVLVAIGGSGTWNEPAHAQVQQGAEVVLRQTFNTSRVVYVETSDGYGVYEHDDTRLFPVPKNVRVRISKLERSRNRLTVEYLHQTLGKGKIEADLREVGDQDEAVRQILWHAFSDPAEPDLYKSVVANRKTDVAHFAGSNHLPPAEDRSEYIDLDEALAAGHRRCGVCFYETPRVSNYLTERALGAECSAQVRFYYPVVVDQLQQERITTLGNRALASWPLLKKGYSYSFELVRSDDANAFACPGGPVFITTGLLDVVEDDAELEAVLAHEIGHVEMRHGYRKLKSAQKAAFWGAVAAVVVGAATSDDLGDAQTFATLTAAVSSIASEIVLSGYSRAFEMESDSLATVYLQSHEVAQGPSPMAQILSKINYSAQVRGGEVGKQNAFSSHPNMSDRIDKAETASIRPTPGWIFEGLNRQGNLVARVEFVLQSVTLAGEGRGLELLGSIETTPLLGEKDKVKDMRVTVGGRDLKLDNKEDTEVWPGDGAGLIFRTDDVTSFLDDISGMRLNLRNVESWRRVGAAVGAASSS